MVRLHLLFGTCLFVLVLLSRAPKFGYTRRNAQILVISATCPKFGHRVFFFFFASFCLGLLFVVSTQMRKPAAGALFSMLY